MLVDFLAFGFLAFLSIPAICGYYAHTHGRSFWLWFAIGTFLPVISYFILLLLPDKTEPLEEELHRIRIQNKMLGLKADWPAKDLGLGNRLKKKSRNIIRFNVHHYGTKKRVSLLIDGYNLPTWVWKAEAPYARKERNALLAGAYQGIPSTIALPPSQHFMGKPHFRYSDSQQRAVLLVCNRTGVVENWAFSARIEVFRKHIVWRDFRNSHRPHWTYSDLGPFVFDRLQYEEALAELYDCVYR